jgi:hypothetical protein
MAIRRRRRVAKKCSTKARKSRHTAWSAFKKKHTRPGMGKAAYKSAVSRYWKPKARVIKRKKRTCKKRAASPSRKRRSLPRRNAKGRFLKKR